MEDAFEKVYQARHTNSLQQLSANIGIIEREFALKVLSGSVTAKLKRHKKRHG